MSRRAKRVLLAIVALAAIAGVAAFAWRREIARAASIDLAPTNARGLVERPVADPRIVVYKSERRLVLLSKGQVVRTFRIALGGQPEGDKVRKGDNRTPEGGFYVCSKNPRSRFHLALGLSYPDAEDAERGLREGWITRAQHEAIVRAIQGRSQPPWDTALGGAILIHGRGADRDWTAGCVALDDPDMRALYEAVPIATPVTILP